jgi:hypothetical protein
MYGSRVKGTRCPKWKASTSKGPDFTIRYHERMAKRIMIAVVGAGMGSLVGLLAAYLGAGNFALVGCAILGAVIPFVFLGQPGH